MLDKQAVELQESRWERESVITRGDSVRLVVEVVSTAGLNAGTRSGIACLTNCRDDYGYKTSDYEALGISEYWIVDYLGLGG